MYEGLGAVSRDVLLQNPPQSSLESSNKFFRLFLAKLEGSLVGSFDNEH